MGRRNRILISLLFAFARRNLGRTILLPGSMYLNVTSSVYHNKPQQRKKIIQRSAEKIEGYWPVFRSTNQLGINTWQEAHRGNFRSPAPEFIEMTGRPDPGQKNEPIWQTKPPRLIPGNSNASSNCWREGNVFSPVLSPDFRERETRLDDSCRREWICAAIPEARLRSGCCHAGTVRRRKEPHQRSGLLSSSSTISAK